MEIKGTINTAVRFNGINKAVVKAAVITDHQGRKKDNKMANIIVAIKLMLFLFISYLVLRFVCR